MLDTDMTMAEAFREVAESHNGQEALVCGEVRETYDQLLERIGALARGLPGLGVRKGDKVAALLSPGPEFIYLFFAVAELADYHPMASMQLILEFGHDTDSYAQVLGAILGALHGKEVFPEEMRRTVNRDRKIR